MEKHVDVAIIGAGSAGLSAVSQVKKKTDNYVIINDGPYGTTCARVGCMPSKVFINVANDFHRRNVFAQTGINGAEHLTVNSRIVMEHVRSLRDRFVRGVMSGPSGDKEKNIAGFARFLEPTLLEVDGLKVRAKAVIIATGTSPVVPGAWKSACGEQLVTTDELFELRELPQRVGVAGLGVIGLELGQAMARLGIQVIGANRSVHIGGLTDPMLIDYTEKLLLQEFNAVMGENAVVRAEGSRIFFTAGQQSQQVDMVLAAIGRRPKLAGLGLENIGVQLDPNGHPPFNRHTMQIGQLPIFYAGDVNGEKQLLHEASDEGRIAGFNAVREESHCFQRRTPLAICFTDPNIAVVGQTYEQVKDRDPIIGEVSYEGQGRALSIVKAKGHMRIYACPQSGKLWGAEMVAPYGEHMAHQLAWMIQKDQTVFDVLQMPFYHPVVEEGMRTALRMIAEQVDGERFPLEMARCGETALDPLC